MYRNIRLLEIQEIMMSAIFIMPVLMPYFRDQIGLNFQDFLLCEAFFAGTLVLLEVPSGWIADIWKRKLTLVLAAVFWTVGFTILIVADNLYTAILSQIIMGVGASLYSGTNSALLYDTLLTLNRENDFTQLEGRRKGLGFYSIAGASLCGGFLYEINQELPMVMTTITGIIAIITALFYQEPARYKSAVQSHPVKDILITVRYALRGHTIVGMIIIFAAALFSATKLIMYIQQPYYMALGVPEALFGVLMAVGYGLGGLASHINHLLEKVMGNFAAILSVWLLAIFVCFGSAVVLGVHGIALLMVGGTFIYGASIPRVHDAINKRVASDRRATILSTANFLREMAFIPLCLIVGWLCTQYGVQAGLYGIVVWLSLAGVCLVIWAHKKG